MKLVLDTSVVGKLFVAEADRPLAVNVFDKAIISKEPMLAPSLMLYGQFFSQLTRPPFEKHKLLSATSCC